MSKVRIYILAVVAAAGIGLGGTFGASAVPINGNLVGATAPAPELQKVYYYQSIRAPTLPASVPPWLLRCYYGGYSPSSRDRATTLALPSLLAM